MLSLLLPLFLHFALPSQVSIANPQGVICVWVHESIKNYEASEVLELKVYLDGKWIGMIDKAFAQTPACETLGVLTRKIDAGKHTIEVKGIHQNAQSHSRKQKVNWKGTFVLPPNAKMSLEIGNHDTPKIVEKRKEMAGDLSVWLHESMTKHLRDIKVYIAGKYEGRLNKGFLQERRCGDEGTINKKLPFGRYEVKVTGIKRNAKASDPKRKFEFKRKVLFQETCFNLPIYYTTD